MTNIEEIIITANILANQGKKPSVALVKAKLTQNVPLPLIISTLKTWQHQSDYIAPKSAKPAEQKVAEVALDENIKQQIDQAVALAIKPLAEEIEQLKQQITLLKK
ncbi:hypothetical protein LP316_09230 [Thalassotalea sp. LPB0316]|uniref:hypothetical protein n=1 Tax=Thalassotalea sp. LPB0316 TaxID=2769490 RepID=UPI001866094A|nr:hypothetical protein [Thalassotalea sp. LPB0316]QOL24540.1 hypothetical protein LP316_09230 [Thalassotalea sp. LPB0316]